MWSNSRWWRNESGAQLVSFCRSKLNAYLAFVLADMASLRVIIRNTQGSQSGFGFITSLNSAPLIVNLLNV